MLTLMTRVPYDPSARAERFERFLCEVHPDEAARAYIARRWGYVLTGEMREQQFWFHFGPGGDGKSVELDIIAYVLGDYAFAPPKGLFIESTKGRSDDVNLSTIVGKRLLCVPEWPSGGRLNLDLLKSLTGGTSELSANKLYCDAFNFAPQAKVIINGNSIPDIASDDATPAFWQRVRVVPYTQTFRGTQRDDRRLTEILRAEGPRVLAWLVRQAVEYYAHDLYPVPDLMRAKAREWRREVDTIAAWISAECILDVHVSAPASELWASYHRFCVTTAVRAFGEMRFYSELNRLGYTVERFKTGNHRRGLALCARAQN